MRRIRLGLAVCHLALVACVAPRPDSPARAEPALPHVAGDTLPELRAAFTLLDTALTPGLRDTLRATAPDALWRYHLSVGLYVRNQLGLWASSPVALAFNRRGVTHPDDMSGVILEAYWLRLHGRPIDLDSLVAAQPPPPARIEEPAPGRH